jgi:diketogulonate reductase-like aldo/keto reductase
MKSLKDTVSLHNGLKMPAIGLGVYKMDDHKETVEAVYSAISCGYRAVDTASLYKNEEAVGEGIRASGLSRDDIFVTTKVWNTDQGYDQTLKAFEESLTKLKLDKVDLYLVHWPITGKYLDTWKALERLYNEGMVKSIGVSNFQIRHLEDIAAHANEKPVLNQVELHPRLIQEELREYCFNQQIAVEAWSPLGRGKLLTEPTLQNLANKHDKSVAQVILRWHLQNNNIIIPKSVHKDRIIENASLFDFELSKDEMDQIDSLNRNERFGANPDDF